MSGPKKDFERSLDRVHKRIAEHGNPHTGERVSSTKAREIAADAVRAAERKNRGEG